MLDVAGLAAGAGLDSKLKSPSPLEELGICKTEDAWVGFVADGGLGPGLVPVSKNPPPLSGAGDFAGGEVKEDREAVEGLLKLAKGSALG